MWPSPSSPLAWGGISNYPPCSGPGGQNRHPHPCLNRWLAAVLVTASMALIFHLPMPFCSLAGGHQVNPAPASTITTIRQYQAKGSLLSTILPGWWPG